MALDKQVFHQAKEEILDKLREYMTRRGYDCNKQFRCPSPMHEDKKPSAGIVPANPRYGHCLGCGITWDVFTMCVWEESKPASGPGWYRDVFLYLAEKFGVAVPDLKLSESELREMELTNAYSHASQIIKSAERKDLSSLVVAKLDEYGWGKDVTYRMGVGSVKSYADYLRRMTECFGHKKEFLEKADLANFSIFNENNLIYTISDADSQPIAFSARDLKYEEKDAVYDQKIEDGELPEYRPMKYFHTANNGTKGKTTLFNKADVIFNFNLARKAPGALVVMEGNADCATAYAAGIHTAVAALGGSFQRTHFDQAIADGKDHIILVFDSDAAGEKHTERVMKLVSEMSGHVGLRVEVLQLPDGYKDPDEYLRSFEDLQTGAREFRALPRIDMFSWQLMKAIKDGEDPYTLCDRTIPLIVNEPKNMMRQRMADHLANAAGMDREFVRREVLRLTDLASMRLDEERALVSNELLKKIRSNPHNLGTYISEAQCSLDSIDQKSSGYDLQAVVNAAKECFNELMANEDKYELLTGFRIFDETLGGIPRKGLFGTLPGKSHHGKSIWMDNLINGLLDHNEDIIVVLHTVDDPQKARVQRLLGSKTGIASKFWRTPGYYLHNPMGQQEAPLDFEKTFKETWDWYFKMMESERLLVVDPSVLSSDLNAVKAWVSALQQKNPDKTIVFFGDNFHLYNMPTEETGEGKLSAMSVFVTTELIATLGISMIFTVEIPKNSFEAGVRPSYQNIKGTGRLTFDAKVDMVAYNQLQDFVARPDKALLYWESDKYMETITNPDMITCMQSIKMPIVEIIVDKNKISGVTKTIFYRLDKFSGQMEECSDAEQITCAEKLCTAAESERANNVKKSYSRAV